MNKQLCLLAFIATYFVSVFAGDINKKLSMILSPNNSSIVTTRTPFIIGALFKNNGKPKKDETVVVYIDGLANGIVMTNDRGIFSYQVRNDKALSNGRHFVYAVTQDSNTYIKGSTFTIEARERSNTYKSGNADVTASYFAYPITGSFFATSTPYIVAVMNDSGNNPVGGEHITYRVDSTVVASNCCATSSSNGVSVYVLTAGQALNDGIHTADVHAVESNIDLPQQTFTVDTTPPAAPTIISPLEDDIITSSTVIVSGIAEINAQVLVYMDTDTGGQLTYADESGNWSIQYDDMENGSHSFNTRQIDLAGNEGDVGDTITFTVSV